MTIALHNLKSAPKKTKKRLGRGNSSGLGTYCGRGQKGQRARSGGKSGLKMKGFKANLVNIPKKRGFISDKNRFQVITLSKLDKFFNDAEKVSPQTLLEKKLIDTIKKEVKIIGSDDLKKKFTIEDCRLTEGAKKSVEKAGGKIEEKSRESEK